MAKVSKASVNYRQASSAKATKRCATCVMFRPSGGWLVARVRPAEPRGACTLVAGKIKGNDVCDRWATR